MDKIIDFLVNAGKLKSMERKGWVLRGIKNPETIAAHTFRTTLMSLVLCCDKKIDRDKVIKMALVHDLCEVYAGDTTPYDTVLPKNKKEQKKIFDKWVRLSKEEKENFFRKKYKKENEGLKKLVSKLPSSTRSEIRNLWNDYEKGLSPEGRFVRQLDRMENLLQALEYQKAGEKINVWPWWVQAEELIDNPILLRLLDNLEKKFC